MKLREILDMEEYLQNRCYCPGEIYDPNGFFYQIFKSDDECCMVGENEGVVAVACGNQILYIFKEDDKKTVNDVTRVDATENNIKIIKELINGKTPIGKLDEFKPGSSQKALDEVMGIADAIIID